MDTIALRFEHRADLTFNANLLLSRLTWLYVNNKKHDRGDLRYTGHQAQSDLGMSLKTYKRSMNDLRAKGYIATERQRQAGSTCAIKVIKGGDGRAVALTWIRGIRLLPGVKSSANALILARLLWLDSYDGSHQGRGYVTYGRLQAFKELGMSVPKYKRALKDIRGGGLATAENDPGTMGRIRVNLQTVTALCSVGNDHASGIQMTPNDSFVRGQKDTTLGVKKIPPRGQKDTTQGSKRYHPQTPANAHGIRADGQISAVHKYTYSNHIVFSYGKNKIFNLHNMSLDTFLCSRIQCLKSWFQARFGGRPWTAGSADELLTAIRQDGLTYYALYWLETIPNADDAYAHLCTCLESAQSPKYVLNCIDTILASACDGGMAKTVKYDIRIHALIEGLNYSLDPKRTVDHIVSKHTRLAQLASAGAPVDMLKALVKIKIREYARNERKAAQWLKDNGLLMTALDTADWGCVDTAIAS